MLWDAILESESGDTLAVWDGRGVCRLEVRYRQMGRSQSMFHRLYRLGGLRSCLHGCGYLRVVTLAACLMATSDVAYPEASQDGEGSAPRSATSQQADKVVYPMRDWGRYLEPSHGKILAPRGNIQAWERSPSGLFLTIGAQVAQFAKGSELKVLETRKRASFFSDDEFYLRVEPANPENTTVESAKCLQPGVQCWVFQGQEDADLPENLIPPNVKPMGP